MDTHLAKTHAARALITLRQQILGGKVSGGTRLLEVALAEELQISRTPVRQALSQLAEEGLLDRAPGGGFVVRGFAYGDVLDTIELRGVLEGTAARLAAERGAAPARLDQLRDLLARLDACFIDTLDLEAYSALNSQFHRLVSLLAGSDVIAREIDRVTRLPFAAPSAFVADNGGLEALGRSLIPAQEQHRALVEAIAAREGARAEAIAREHARLARRNVEYLFHASPEIFGRAASLAILAP
jgi:GntR family transcriptional regulator, vanillate catabolism transcriptional regulator